MTRRVLYRLRDIDEALSNIDRLLAGRTRDDLRADPIAAAAFERFLEIVSEATRHLPDDLKKDFGHIPWRRVADLGNVLRHAYHLSDMALLWDVYRSDLPALRDAVKAMSAKVEEGPS